MNAAGDDFHLTADSPLVDAGTPGDLPAGSADRDGSPRASDGDGDCTHVPDIGAFELQGTEVRAIAAAGAATASAGQAVGFSADGSCIPGSGAPTIGWSFDDGTSATGAAITHAFATPGRHTATVTVSDGDGHQARASAGVDVTAPPAPPATTPVSAAAATPVISELRVAPRRIKIGTLLPKLGREAAKRPVGTIRFSLSKAATVRLRFAKLGKDGATRTVKTRVRIKAKPGVNRIRFAGRLSRKVRLKPAAYRLTMVATDATGARSRSATALFTVITATRHSQQPAARGRPSSRLSCGSSARAALCYGRAHQPAARGPEPHPTERLRRRPLLPLDEGSTFRRSACRVARCWSGRMGAAAAPDAGLKHRCSFGKQQGSPHARDSRPWERADCLRPAARSHRDHCDTVRSSCPSRQPLGA